MKRKIFSAGFLLVLSHALFSQSYVPELKNARVIVNPAAPIKAYAFSLKDVKLLDGSPFKNAMEKDAAYLLVIEPDRLLFRFYQNAGLPDQRRNIWRLGKRRVVGSYPRALSFSLCNVLFQYRECRI